MPRQSVACDVIHQFWEVEIPRMLEGLRGLGDCVDELCGRIRRQLRLALHYQRVWIGRLFGRDPIPWVGLDLFWGGEDRPRGPLSVFDGDGNFIPLSFRANLHYEYWVRDKVELLCGDTVLIPEVETWITPQMWDQLLEVMPSR